MSLRSYTSIVETSKRSFLFRDVALELFFSDKRNFLCVFRTKKERQNVLQRLANKTDPNAMNKSALGNFVLDTVSKALDKMAHELENVTKRWQQREISNVRGMAYDWSHCSFTESSAPVRVSPSA